MATGHVILPMSIFEHSIVGVLYFTIGIIGTVGNLLTFIVFMYQKPVKSPRNLVFANFALANTFVVAPFIIPGSSSFVGRWLFGDTACQAYAFEGMIAGIGAVGALIVLGVERYLAIRCKDLYLNLSSGNVMCMILLGWLNALFWAAMPLLGWCRYSIEPSGTSCTLDWQVIDDQYISYVTGLTTFCYCIPFAVLFLCLIRASNSLPAETESAEKTSPKTESEEWFTEKQLLKLAWVFTLTALIGWGPYAYVVIWPFFNDMSTLTAVLAVLPPLMAKASTMIYPFAYMSQSSTFRKAMFLTLGCGEQEKKAK
uniref:Peropsin n=2 Tax=Chiton TaxID=256107 RepID=A0A8H2S110_9MOLL|nr:Peropsin [Chiton tuberculatus]QKY89037.1 Peropsin [Chiton marmoratus]